MPIKAIPTSILSKASAEKTNKSLQGQLNELNKRMTEGNLQLQDMDNGNRRAAADNSELLRKLEEVDGNIGTLNKAKISLTNQVSIALQICIYGRMTGLLIMVGKRLQNAHPITCSWKMRSVSVTTRRRRGSRCSADSATWSTSTMG